MNKLNLIIATAIILGVTFLSDSAHAGSGCSTGGGAPGMSPATGTSYSYSGAFATPRCDPNVANYLSSQAQVGASNFVVMHQKPAPTLGQRLESCLEGLLRFPSINPLGSFSIDSLLSSLVNAACNLARQQVQGLLSGVPGFGQNSFYPPGLSIPGVGTIQGPGIGFGTQPISSGSVNNLLNFGSGDSGDSSGYAGSSHITFSRSDVQTNLMNSNPPSATGNVAVSPAPSAQSAPTPPAINTLR